MKEWVKQKYFESNGYNTEFQFMFVDILNKKILMHKNDLLDKISYIKKFYHIFLIYTEPSESYEKLNTFKPIIENESFITDENYLYLEKTKIIIITKENEDEKELNKNNLYYEIGILLLWNFFLLGKILTKKIIYKYRYLRQNIYIFHIN